MSRLTACFQISLSLQLSRPPPQSLFSFLCVTDRFSLNMVVCTNLEMDLYHPLSVSLFTFHRGKTLRTIPQKWFNQNNKRIITWCFKTFQLMHQILGISLLTQHFQQKRVLFSGENKQSIFRNKYLAITSLNLAPQILSGETQNNFEGIKICNVTCSL